MAQSTIPARRKPVEDLTGRVFGRLTVIAVSVLRKRDSITYECACTCGRRTLVVRADILRGNTRSCGCLGQENRDRGRHAAIRHHQSATKEYAAWRSMLERCRTPTHHAWKDYGGRGITVCERWMRFEEFIADMGPRPSSKHSLDRIKNDEGYGPDNCRWATRREQALNRRNTMTITFKGETRTVCDWEDILGFPRAIIYTRLKHMGWSVEKACTQPLRPYRHGGGPRIKKPRHPVTPSARATSASSKPSPLPISVTPFTS